MTKKKRDILHHKKKKGILHKEKHLIDMKKKFTAGSVYASVVLVAILCLAAGYALSSTSPGSNLYVVGENNPQSEANNIGTTENPPTATLEAGNNLYYIVSEGCDSCDSLKSVAQEIADTLGVGLTIIDYFKQMSVPGYVLVYDNKLTINGVNDKYSFEQTVCDVTSSSDICDMATADKPEDTTPPAPDVPKSDKPKAEVFIMSHCPFGLQMEKAVIPVMETLKDKADIKIRWVNYAMHGEKEITDNNIEYCIQKEQNDKFTDYVRCFVEKGDAQGCYDKVGIDKDKLDKCINETDQTFGITAGYNDKTKWKGNFPPYPVDDALNQKYGVRGSPTTVINGVVASVARSQQAVLDAICAAFNNPPEECKTKLSTSGEGSGFGPIGSGNGAAASSGGCG